MINLSKSGDTIVFEFINNGHYLENGTIEVPVNSLSLVTDSSNMATFYKADSGDIFISATYDELGKTKAEMLEWFEENMVAPQGGGGGGGVTSGQVQTMIDDSVSGFADSVLYNSTSKYVEFYNGGTGGTKVYEFDASDFVIDGMVDDVRIETISGVSYLVIDFNTASGKEDIQIPLTDIFDPSNYYTKTETNTLLGGKQDTLSAGTNITIVDNVISAEGGGKAIEAGRGIDITTGATADTVSFNLPISAGTGTGALVIASDTYKLSDKATGSYAVSLGGGGIHPNYAIGASSLAEGSDTIARGEASHAEGYATSAGTFSFPFTMFDHAEGSYTHAAGGSSHAEGEYTFAAGYYSHTEGYHTIAKNSSEHASGRYNISSSASTTFGDSGNTLFSVGNGTADNARHNAFEIRQNGDIYITSSGTDIKLQDHLGGGGGKAIEAGRGISVTTGETADTVSFNLPISAGTGTRSIVEGDSTIASGTSSHAEGSRTKANGTSSHAEGSNTKANNLSEHASGQYNNSVSASTTFGDSGNTLFSVGNGTSDNARHNAFEIRQNGDIYYFDGTNDVKLQDKFSSLDTTIGNINSVLNSI